MMLVGECDGTITVDLPGGAAIEWLALFLHR